MQQNLSNDTFSCPICIQFFDDCDKIPKILICGHTLCKQCTIQMKDLAYVPNNSRNLANSQHNPEQDGQNEENGELREIYKCPTCKKHTHSKIEDMPTVYALIPQPNQICYQTKFLPPQQECKFSHSFNNQRDQGKSNHNISHFCTQCQLPMCSKCANTHQGICQSNQTQSQLNSRQQSFINSSNIQGLLWDMNMNRSPIQRRESKDSNNNFTFNAEGINNQPILIEINSKLGELNTDIRNMNYENKGKIEKRTQDFHALQKLIDNVTNHKESVEKQYLQYLETLTKHITQEIQNQNDATLDFIKSINSILSNHITSTQLQLIEDKERQNYVRGEIDKVTREGFINFLLDENDQRKIESLLNLQEDNHSDAGQYAQNTLAIQQKINAFLDNTISLPDPQTILNLFKSNQKKRLNEQVFLKNIIDTLENKPIKHNILQQQQDSIARSDPSFNHTKTRKQSSTFPTNKDNDQVQLKKRELKEQIKATRSSLRKINKEEPLPSASSALSNENYDPNYQLQQHIFSIPQTAVRVLGKRGRKPKNANSVPVPIQKVKRRTQSYANKTKKGPYDPYYKKNRKRRMTQTTKTLNRSSRKLTRDQRKENEEQKVNQRDRLEEMKDQDNQYGETLIQNEKENQMNQEDMEEGFFHMGSTQATQNYMEMIRTQQNQMNFSSPDRNQVKNRRHYLQQTEKTFKTPSSNKSHTAQEMQVQSSTTYIRRPKNLSQKKVTHTTTPDSPTSTNTYGNKSRKYSTNTQEQQSQIEMIASNQLQIQRNKIKQETQVEVQEEEKEHEQVKYEPNFSNAIAKRRQSNGRNNDEKEEPSPAFEQLSSFKPITRSSSKKQTEETKGQSLIQKFNNVIMKSSPSESRLSSGSNQPLFQKIQIVMPYENKQILVLDMQKLNKSDPWSEMYYELETGMHPTTQYQSLINVNCACAMWPGKPGWMLITGGGTMNTLLFKYNASTNKATIEKLEIKMNHPRLNHQLIYCNGAFYALGGESSGGVTNTCEKLILNPDTLQGNWQPISNMKGKRRLFGAVTYGPDKILAIGSGGLNKSLIHNSMETYNTKHDIWNVIPLLKLPLQFENIQALNIGLTEDQKERIVIFGTPIDSQYHTLSKKHVAAKTVMMNLYYEPKNLHQTFVLNNHQLLLNSRRIVKGNIFHVDKKIIILGGNNNYDGEYVEISNGQSMATPISSYQPLSQNPLNGLPGGVFKFSQ